MNTKLNRCIMAFVLIATLCVCGFFCSQKSGLFIDEIYTYGLSNSFYAPFIKNVADGDMVDKVISKQDMLDYLTVGGDEAFSFASVYYNQTQDVHPPLYYWLINAVSSIFSRGTFSVYPALALNCIFYLLILILLYKICNELFENATISAVTALLFGLSTVGISVVLMVRMYILLTLLTVVFTYFVIRFLKNGRISDAVFVMLSVFLGLMTQYYFVFYAFFVCLAVDIYIYIYEKRKRALIFSAFSLLGVLLFVCAYPAVFSHLFADKLVSGKNALENALSFSKYLVRIYSYSYDALFKCIAGVAVGTAMLVLAFVFRKRIFKLKRENKISFLSLIFISAAILNVLVVAVISPISALRYIYNIMPIFYIAIAFLVYINMKAMKDLNKKVACILSFSVALILSLSALCVYKPDYLYLNYRKYDALCSENSIYPCVYFNDNYNAPITQDMLQLMYYDEVYVSNNTKSEKMLDYIDNHQHNECVIVYVDVSEEWSSGYDAEKIIDELMSETGYGACEKLYKQGLSDVYKISARAGDAR